MQNRMEQQLSIHRLGQNIPAHLPIDLVQWLNICRKASVIIRGIRGQLLFRKITKEKAKERIRKVYENALEE